jgi:hypothetical protein
MRQPKEIMERMTEHWSPPSVGRKKEASEGNRMNNQRAEENI